MYVPQLGNSMAPLPLYICAALESGAPTGWLYPMSLRTTSHVHVNALGSRLQGLWFGDHQGHPSAGLPILRSVQYVED